jgi:hypothetical protein
MKIDWFAIPITLACSFMLVRNRGRWEYARGVVLFFAGVLVGALAGHLH